MKFKSLLIFVSSIAFLSGCSEQYTPHKDFSYDDFVNYFIEENKTLGTVDVLAVGDSLTYHYDFGSYFKGLNIVNHGISGDTTTGLLNHMEASIYDVDTKVITLWIGINNLADMMNDYEYILSGIKEHKPNVKTILISLTPTRDYASYLNEMIVERNEEIKVLANKYSYTYLDIHSKLLDSSGELDSKYSFDG